MQNNTLNYKSAVQYEQQYSAVPEHVSEYYGLAGTVRLQFKQYL